MFVTNSLKTDLILALATLVIVAYVYIKRKYSYWNRRKLPQLTPTFPFGNCFKGLPRGISLGAYSKNFYDAFKQSGHSLGGVYLGLDPHLIVVDPVYAKDILTKDFSYFMNRGLYFNRKNPITVNILTQEEAEWRAARTKFTGIFTSAKMKFFFGTIKKCSDELKFGLESVSKDDADVDIYEIMACYFTDVIGSITYGIEANSFKDPDAIIRKLGRELFGTFSIPFRVMLFFSICYPKLAKMIGIGSFQPHVEKFFFDFVPKTLEYRIKNNIHRADLLQLLIEMKSSGMSLTIEEIVGQTFIFFTGGFETSTAASQFILYELGLHQDIQDRVKDEINQTLKKYNGEITYESIHELKYLDQVCYESLRKYPAITTLNRVCVKDYKFPNSDVIIEKGTSVLLSVLGFHRDPANFPDPMKFDPDRFEDKTVKHNGFFPFGDGPRNCLAARLGLLQVKMGVTEVVRNYRITVSQRTKDPIEIDERTFVIRTAQKIYLKLNKITN